MLRWLLAITVFAVGVVLVFKGMTANGETPKTSAARDLDSTAQGAVVSEGRFFAAAGEPDDPDRPSYREQRQRAAQRGNWIDVPSLRTAMPVVDSPVVKGVMDVPPGIDSVGWLTTSADPNDATGVTTLATHRDLGNGRRGVKNPLWDIWTATSVGETFTLHWEGRRTTYRVSRVETIGNRLPRSVVRQTGPRRLALFSCGGTLRKHGDTFGWDGKVIAWAEPVG